MATCRTGLFGRDLPHKFEARYEDRVMPEGTGPSRVYTGHDQNNCVNTPIYNEEFVYRTYIGDICVHCGTTRSELIK